MFFQSEKIFSAGRKAIPLPVFLLGTVAVLMPFFTWDLSRLPGDFDTVFNGYVLEHGYLWLTGRENSFLNAPFFYPAPLALAYSDIHYGNLPLYALLRFCGLPPTGALGAWIFLQCVLNYAVCFAVLKNWKYSITAASLGALLFTYAMPVAAQMGHIQLLPRYPALCAVGCAVSFCRNPRSAAWGGLWFSICWQFAASVYLGVMTSGLLLLTLICTFFLDRRALPPFRQWCGNTRLEKLLRLVLLLLPLLLIQRMLAPCAEVWKGLSAFKPLSLSICILPHPFDWFRPADAVFCWRKLAGNFPADGFAGERALFAGIVAAFLFCRVFFRKKRRMFLPVCTAILAALFFMEIGKYGIFLFFRNIVPGLAGIRCPVRVVLLLLFVPALLLADFWDDPECRRLRWLMIPLLAADLLILPPVQNYSPEQFQQKVDHLKQKLAVCPPDTPFFYVTSHNGAEGSLTAMVAAQQLHLKTVNGYSGHNPPYWMLDPDNCTNSLTFWMGYSQGAYGKGRNFWTRGIYIVR